MKSIDLIAKSELQAGQGGRTYNHETHAASTWMEVTQPDGNVTRGAVDLGPTQGLRMIELHRNGQIEARNNLDLSGNARQAGNQTTSNADLQRNNVQWLDANGDGVLDKSDPAFAAIELLVDLNQDVRLYAGKQTDRASLQITSINFQKSEVTDADGHGDALSASTLQSDTECMIYTQMQDADAVDHLHTINAGQMRYLFDSNSRISHNGQRPYLREASYSPDWGICA